MESKRDNLILIGMPGCGKSTVGVVLAKVLGFQFMDSDLLIQEQESRLLKDIIAEDGLERFLEIEDRVNAQIDCEHTIIATGGSVIYGLKAMQHLRQIGTVIYLKLSCEAISERLGDLNERGVVLKQGQDLYSLYEERCPLYEKYAHITINAEEKSIREMTERIICELTRGIE